MPPIKEELGSGEEVSDDEYDDDAADEYDEGEVEDEYDLGVEEDEEEEEEEDSAEDEDEDLETGALGSGPGMPGKKKKGGLCCGGKGKIKETKNPHARSPVDLYTLRSHLEVQRTMSSDLLGALGFLVNVILVACVPEGETEAGGSGDSLEPPGASSCPPSRGSQRVF
jgi:hypothetical protein